MRGFSLIPNADTSEIEAILLKNGQLQAVEYNAIKDFPQHVITCFCVKHAVYQIITTELVDFVKAEIGNKKAIEIGAGNGCLGRSLGIPITDNRMQEWPVIKFAYEQAKQTPITYPSDTIHLPADKAIETLKPDMIVGSWITQKCKPHIQTDCNTFGVDEAAFKGIVERYIMVGNEQTHGAKEILQIFPYKKIQFPWLISRSMAYEKNFIYLFVTNQ